MDTPTSLAKKIDEYLRAGASIAWIAKRFHLSQSELEDLGLVDVEPESENHITGY